eukprot:TRINITY_DN8023_c0_g1_i1.p1 TRINITY_DN8023_c0_g1~~TRINITY_DN8023_c0_g1_i1.p1  ORF type:complete len:347 (+),score=76.95 TRINITY_DN8023_c0_g1_i1:45-1085(+)
MEQPKKPVRVWMDLCADLFHWGHANALRQAKQLGDVLVVGVHTDAEVNANKGPPVLNENERMAVVKACRWVDETSFDAPYQTSLEVLNKYDIDFCVHGEDLSTDATGKDSYWEVKAAGKFQLIKRTTEISTTDLVGRMLLVTKNHFSTVEEATKVVRIKAFGLPATTLQTDSFSEFSDGREPGPGDKIVYIDGAWDLFHAGHVDILEKAKKLGDFVIVGVHSDIDVNGSRGTNFPIMNLHERALTVLSCRYADQIILAPPVYLTEEFLKEHNISVVAHGTEKLALIEPDPYAVPKKLGIYKEVESTSGLSTAGVINRIIENRRRYEERNRIREEKDALLTLSLIHI